MSATTERYAKDPYTGPTEDMTVTAKMFPSLVGKTGFGLKVELGVAYANGANDEWAASTPVGSVSLQVGKGLPAAKMFDDAIDAGDDILVTFQRIKRGS